MLRALVELHVVAVRGRAGRSRGPRPARAPRRRRRYRRPAGPRRGPRSRRRAHAARRYRRRCRPPRTRSGWDRPSGRGAAGLAPYGSRESGWSSTTKDSWGPPRSSRGRRARRLRRVPPRIRPGSSSTVSSFTKSPRRVAPRSAASRLHCRANRRRRRGRIARNGHPRPPLFPRAPILDRCGERRPDRTWRREGRLPRAHGGQPPCKPATRPGRGRLLAA